MSEQPKWIRNKIKYNEEYNKENYKQINFRVRKDYYETVLVPALKASGESANAFIKTAIDQRIGIERGE